LVKKDSPKKRVKRHPTQGVKGSKPRLKAKLASRNGEPTDAELSRQYLRERNQSRKAHSSWLERGTLRHAQVRQSAYAARHLSVARGRIALKLASRNEGDLVVLEKLG